MDVGVVGAAPGVSVGWVLFCCSEAPAALPELLDVRLMAMSPHAFTPTGFERVDSVEYAQSWLVSERE